jgi:endonuclease/exonuclease/phosphatase family metal-dependent hydrolase
MTETYLSKISYIVTFAVIASLTACSDSGDFPEDASDASEWAPDAAADAGVPTYDQGKKYYDIAVGPPVALSVATFNVQNFFDELDDPNHADTVFSKEEVAEKIKKIGIAIRKLSVDVLVLQEVENKDLLDRLNKEELSSLSYDHVRLVEGNDIRGIDVALLSKYPVPRALSHTWDRFLPPEGGTQNYAFSRDCLEATIEPSPGRKLILLVNHLRATQWNEVEESLTRRHAQAKRVREITDQLLLGNPDRNIAVIGDLNDVPGSETLKLIIEGNPKLIDIAETVPEQHRYTSIYKGDKQQIDHIIVTPGLEADLIAGSVWFDHSDEFSDVSDHFPIKAEFLLE